VVAFTRSVPARHGARISACLRRPPTSCAHRLRKPDRTYELLAPHVARWSRSRGLLAPRLRARPPGCDGSLAGRRKPDTFHRARPAVAAVGLERRPPYGPGHLRSDRHGPCGPSRPGCARCSRAPPRPAPCRSLRAWACLVKGRLVASSYPIPLRGLSAARRLRKDASHRLLQPTPFTSTLRTVRFLAAPAATLHLAVSRDAPRALRPAETMRWLTLGLDPAAARPGSLPVHLPDEPTKWSFA